MLPARLDAARYEQPSMAGEERVVTPAPENSTADAVQVKRDGLQSARKERATKLNTLRMMTVVGRTQVLDAISHKAERLTTNVRPCQRVEGHACRLAALPAVIRY